MMNRLCQHFKDMKYPETTDDYFTVTYVEQVINKVQERDQFSDLLKFVLTSKDLREEEHDDDLAKMRLG